MLFNELDSLIRQSLGQVFAAHCRERNLDPNVDFYSGITFRALGFPVRMFTVLFAIGRLPGWIAQWKEMMEDPNTRIGRPRQVYLGEVLRDYVPVDGR